MAFNRPTLSDIVDRITSDFETRLSGVGTLLRRSFLKIMAKVYAGAVHTLWGYLEYMSKQLFASTAEGDYLDKIASEYSLSRTAGTYATGTATATGVNGTVIPAGTELQSDGNIIYEVDEDVTIAGGVGTLNLTAQEIGDEGNNTAGITLTFISPITDIDTTVTVGVDGLEGGADEEDDEGLRDRILLKKRNAPHGGAQHDLVNWCLEISGVTRAWAFPLYMGAGTVGVAFVRDNDASIIPSETLKNEVKDYLLEHDDPVTGETVGIPVTMEPGLFMLSLTARSVDFNISIYPNTTAVQTAIQNELEDLILRDGGPGETLYLSRIVEAIGLAAGEEYSRLNSPLADITCSNTQIHTLGTITFSNY